MTFAAASLLLARLRAGGGRLVGPFVAGRRHLKPSQCSMVGGRAREMYDRAAKERHEKLSGRPSKSEPVENLPPVSSGKARDQAGKAVGVSGRRDG